MRDATERVRDMLEAIARVERYASRGRGDFDSDELVQTYILHHLQIVCEAAYKLPPDFCAAHGSVPWAKIQGMRHILVHDYFQINLAIVWDVVSKELPILKPQLEAILKLLAP